MTTTQKKQFWHEHITQWQNARITQLAYCRQYDLCPHKFGYYKRILNSTTAEAQLPRCSASGFVSVQVLPQLSQPESLTLHFNNGLRLSGIATDNLGLVKQLAQVLS